MKVITHLTKEQQISNRKIGGTDLCAIVNGKGRWNNILDIYDRLVSNKKTKPRVSTRISNGVKAENHIRELYLISNSNLEKQYSENEYITIVSDKNDLITLSPDTVVIDKETGELGFIEIKFKEINERFKIADYMLGLKEKEPQYYWQLIHYFVVMEKAQFGHFVVCFLIKEQNKTFDKLIVETLKIKRETISDDIELATQKLNEFIENNVDPKRKPYTEEGDLEIWKNFMN